jgi:2-polyprenyl-3-methyl-5-hydroxy-6-metoxy-1,4-benzoquinol methylase
MRRYTNRTPAALHEVHQTVTHGTMLINCHRPRIFKTREFIENLLRDMGGEMKTIVELGCSIGEITGPFSFNSWVYGYDVNEKALSLARSDYPAGTWKRKPLEDVEPFECDILVICEVLEHLADPMSLVKAWMPKAKYSIISHPIDETDEQAVRLSGGTHEWSLTVEDMHGWFYAGGHKCIDFDSFTLDHTELGMGTCDTILAVGKNINGF